MERCTPGGRPKRHRNTCVRCGCEFYSCNERLRCDECQDHYRREWERNKRKRIAAEREAAQP